MALIVEDGSQVDGADSFVSVADLRAYAVSRGVEDLPAEDAELEVMLRKGCDYITSLRSSFQGFKVTYSQPLQWPRVGVSADGFPVESDAVPNDIASAQCELALSVHRGKDLQPDTTGAEVVEKQVAVLRTKWAASGVVSKQEFAKANALLEPYLKTSSGLTSQRV